MKENVKTQMIFESFDVLKDLWDSKEEAIRRLICRMFKEDPETAVEMWLYVLRNNKKTISRGEEYEASALTNNMLCFFFYGLNYENYYNSYDNEKEMALSKILLKNKELRTILFSKNKGIGDETYHLLAHIIASDKPDILIESLNLIKDNKAEDFTIGHALTVAIEHLGVSVPQQNIEILEQFVSNIKDKQDRAEAFTALLSLDND